MSVSLHRTEIFSSEVINFCAIIITAPLYYMNKDIFSGWLYVLEEIIGIWASSISDGVYRE